MVYKKSVRPITDTYKTAKSNSFWHVKGRGYNKNCVLYPRPMTCQKESLLFHVCQLWALHVVIKLQSKVLVAVMASSNKRNGKTVDFVHIPSFVTAVAPSLLG